MALISSIASISAHVSHSSAYILLFHGCLQVAGWCEAHYVDLMPHNPFGPVCTAACIHVGAAVPNFCAMECFQVRNDAVLLCLNFLRDNQPFAKTGSGQTL